MRNQSLHEMSQQLEKLKRECQQFIAESQQRTQELQAVRPSITPTPQPSSAPDPAPAPATEPKKQWRFMNEEGRIPESIVRKAVVDPNLLEAIAAEIEERSAQERQG
jgi:hypothetical protein